MYSFTNYCEQDKALQMDDGTKKIFVNTKGIQDDIDDEAIAARIEILMEEVKALRKTL